MPAPAHVVEVKHETGAGTAHDDLDLGGKVGLDITLTAEQAADLPGHLLADGAEPEVPVRASRCPEHRRALPGPVLDDGTRRSLQRQMPIALLRRSVRRTRQDCPEPLRALTKRGDMQCPEDRERRAAVVGIGEHDGGPGGLRGVEHGEP